MCGRCVFYFCLLCSPCDSIPELLLVYSFNAFTLNSRVDYGFFYGRRDFHEIGIMSVGHGDTT